MRELTQKQSNLYSGDVFIYHQRNRVITEMDDIPCRGYKNVSEFSNHLRAYLCQFFEEAKPDKRAFHRWAKVFHKHYDNIDSRGQVLCPITKYPGSRYMRRAVRLVPSKLSYETIGHVFDNDNGYKIFWSMGNGISMDYSFAYAFNNFDCCLLPQVVAGKPDEFKLVLMNESLRHDFVIGGKTWDEYDGTVLQFREGRDARPERRFVFFHYWMCALKARREHGVGQLWSIPGNYIRKSIAEKVGEFVGEHLRPVQAEIIESMFEGRSIYSSREDIGAKEVLSLIIQRYQHEENSLLEDELEPQPYDRYR